MSNSRVSWIHGFFLCLRAGHTAGSPPGRKDLLSDRHTHPASWGPASPGCLRKAWGHFFLGGNAQVTTPKCYQLLVSSWLDCQSSHVGRGGGGAVGEGGIGEIFLGGYWRCRV